MITSMITLTSACVYVLSHSMNPVKMSITLMILSSAAFLSMHLASGSTWFPMLFFMLFMGGILIVFMIISAVMPNEKVLKTKMIDYVWIALLIFFSSLMVMSSKNTNIYNMQIKWIFNSSMNMTLIMVLIMVYFTVFVKLVTQEKMSLRSESCQ